jgi:DNA-binding response OmpR family regulator
VAVVAKRRSLRIVIADDDHDAVRTLMLLLRSEGHDVRAVYRGSDVLPTVRDFDPDVVLLDIAMPEMSGHRVARAIREWHPGKGPLLIGISGLYQQNVDRTLAALNGFNHYLLKPYDFQDLLALLR